MNRRDFLKGMFQSAALIAATTYCPSVLKDLTKLAPKLAAEVRGDFQKFVFPIIRSVYPQLSVSDIVSVQPMSGPVSSIFYLDHVKPEPKLSWWRRVFKREEKKAEVLDGSWTDTVEGRQKAMRDVDRRQTATILLENQRKWMEEHAHQT